MVYKMLIFLSFFVVFQLKQKQEYQLKAKHFIPPQVRMIKVEYMYCTLIGLKTVVQEINVHTCIILYNSFKFIFC